MLTQDPIVVDRSVLADRFSTIRQMTRRLGETLTPEDCCLQSMPDASPIRWHLAHTTWFFETFLLAPRPGYRSSNPQYAYLFNSYYNAVGRQFPRARRGMLSRPSVAEIWQYREEIDDAVFELLNRLSANQVAEVSPVVELGLQHEQQHQELMLTDIKHAFSENPLDPVYRQADFPISCRDARPLRWHVFEEGVYEIGHDGGGFAYDNESPRHRVFLDSYAIADRLVTAGEYLAFIEDGGYERPELWLSEGWATVQQAHMAAPLYWRHDGDGWSQFTLAGRQPLDLQRPVCHVSYYEADAFARWAGARPATEAEWEVAAETVSPETRRGGGFVDRLLAAGLAVHSTAAASARDDSPSQLFGDVWEWTSSPYAPYPGYRPPDGALGEYNGKFMCNQYVLRGGSCAGSSDHLRPTYRNFFPAAARWQFSGIRLAKDAGDMTSRNGAASATGERFERS